MKLNLNPIVYLQCFGGGGSSPPPEIPVRPAQPVQVPQESQEDATVANEVGADHRRRAAAASNTNATGGRGVTGAATTQAKTLLGR